MGHDLGVVELPQPLEHVIVRNYGLVYRGEGGLDVGRVLEHVHDPLKVILRKLSRRGSLLVVRLEKGVIILGHIIHAPYAFFHGLGETDVCRRLGEPPRVELVIVERALLGRRHGNLLVSGDSRALEDGLEMVFLRVSRSVPAPCPQMCLL